MQTLFALGKGISARSVSTVY